MTLVGLAVTWTAIRAQSVARLTDGAVSPTSGPPGTFTFSVTYTHDQNLRPETPQVSVEDAADGFPVAGSPFALTSTDNTYNDGAVFTANVALPAGRYQYTFGAYVSPDDIALGPIQGPVVNTPPVLSAASVTPTTGDASTLFDFQVTYKDADEHAPRIAVVIDDEVLYFLERRDTTPYSLGSVFGVQITLRPGVHSHYFQADDELAELAVLPAGADADLTLALVGPANGARFSGTVTDAGTGAPVSDGWVSSDYTGAATGPDGKYVVFGSAGTYDLRVDPPAGANLMAATTTVTVAVGEDVTRDFALQPGGSIEGVVTGEAGLGVQDAIVRAYRLDGAFVDTQTTDAAGHFGFTRLPVGRLLLEVEPPSGANLVGKKLAVTSVSGQTVTQDLALEVGAILQCVVKDSALAPEKWATVTVTGVGVYRVTATDVDGTAMVDALPAGSYRVVVDPYSESGLQTEELNVDLGTGQTLPVEFILKAKSEIRGLVQDEAGEPLPFPDVYAVRLADGAWFYSEVSGGDGTYSMRVPPGTYRVTAGSSGIVPARSRPRGKPSGRANGSNLLNGVQTGVVVTEGAALTVDFRLVAGGVVQGTVTDHLGAAVDGAQVTLYLDDGAYRAALTDAAGAYSLDGIPKGHWRLDVSPPLGSPNLARWHDFVTVAPGNTTTRDVTLPLGSFIRVTVTSAAGPVANALASVYPASVYAYTGADGVATVGPVEAGTYEVAVYPPGGNTLERYSRGGVVVAAGQTVDVAALLQSTGSIAGTIRDADANPVSGVSVSLGGAAYRYATTGADGAYRFDGLSTGSYQISAQPPSGAALLQNTAALYLDPGQNVTRDIPLPPSGVLEGQVLDSADAPVPSAQVHVDAVGAGFHGSITAGADGRYRMAAIPPGIYDITAYPPAGVNALPAVVSGITVRPGAPVTQDVRLEATGSLSGVILGPDSQPVSATVTARYVRHYAAQVEVVATGADGRYAFTRLPAGKVDLDVTGPSGTARQTVPGIAVTVGAAATRDVTLVSIPDPAAIRVVVTLDGAPVGLCEAALSSTGGQRQVETGTDGVALFTGLVPDTYSVSVRPPSSTGAIDAQVDGITVAAGETREVRVLLVLGGVVEGSVTDSLGLPVAGAQVRVQSPVLPNGAVFGVCGPDGAFRLDRLPTGTYELTAKPPSGVGVAARRISGIAVTTGQTTHTDVVLSPGATLRGVVTDAAGARVAGATVCIEGPEFYESAGTDRDGTYVIPFIQPDTYQVRAVPPGGTNQLESPYASIVLADGATVQHDIVLPLGRVLEGRVTDGGGAGIPNTRVDLYAPSSGTFDLTDDQGNYRFDRLVGERVSVFFKAPDRLNLAPAGFRDVLLSGTPTTRLDVTLRTGATLTGVVTFQGAPVQDAAVGLQGPGENWWNTSTDTEGRYTLNRIPTGVHRMSVTPPGGRNLSAAFQDLWVEVGQPGTTVVRNVALPEQGVLSGQVVDSAGQPVANGQASLHDEAGSSRGSAWLDTTGRFRFERLAAGRYRVTVSLSDGNKRNLPSHSRSGIVVAAGSETTVTLTLPVAARLAGQVTDAGGQPVSGAEVLLTSPAGTHQTARTDGTGAYELGALAAGRYSVIVQPPYGSSLVMLRANDVVLGAGAATRNFVLQAGSTVAVRVTDAAGNPVYWATVRLSSADLEAPGSYLAYTNDDGMARFLRVAPGLYDLSASPPGAATAASLLAQRRSGIRVAPGATVDLPPITFGASGSIGGRVDAPGGGGAPGVSVFARGPGGESRGVVSDSAGDYRIDGLPPGPYWVEASPDPTTGLVGASVAGVAVTAGATTNQNLLLSTGGQVSGRVTDGTGPVPGADIILWLAGSQMRTITDSDGRYAFGGLRPGTYSLMVSPPAQTGLLPATVGGISLAAAQQVTRDVVLAAGGIVQGRVRLADGGPASYARIALRQGGAERASAYTLPDGTYRLAGLQAGVYDALVAAEDYVHAPPAPAVLPNIAVTQGQTTPLDVALGAGGALVVTLLDGAGNPVPEARVELEYTEPPVFAGASQEAVTDSNGQARLGKLWSSALGFWEVGLPTGVCRVSITPPARLNVMPQSLDGIGIVAGQEAQRSVTLGEGAEVGGRVTDGAGAALGSVGIELAQSYPGEAWYSGETDSTGAYRFDGVAPGTYALNLVPSTVQPHFLGKTVSGLAVAAGTPLVQDVVLDRAAVLGGLVTDPSAAPVVDARLVISSLDGSYYGTTSTDSAGKYLVGALGPGDYEVRASPPGHLNLAPTKVRVTVAAGADTTQDVRMPAGAAIEGRIQDEDGNPIPQVTVQATGPSGAYSVSDQAGAYRLDQLPGGSYRLLASAAYDSPFLTQLIAGVDVAAGATATRNLVLRRYGELRGRITTAGGQPVSGARISASTAGGYGYAGEGMSDSSGSYHMAGVPTGAVIVRISPAAGSGLLPAVREGVPVVARQTTVADFTLAAAAALTGVVRDARGLSVEGAALRVVRSERGTLPVSATADTAGHYVAEQLAPDRYDVTAEPPASVAGSLLPQTVHNVVLGAGETRALDFALADGGAIQGTVLDEGGQPLPGSVRVVGVAPDGMGAPQYGAFERWVPIGADGRYFVAGVPAGAFTVEPRVIAAAPRVRQVARVVVGAGQTVDQSFTLSAGGQIAGRVTGEGGAGVPASVTVGRPGQAPQDWIRTATDAAGSYQVAGLAPAADYQVRVEAAAANLQEAEQTVAVTAGQTTTADFQLVAGSALEGQVADSGGGSVALARLHLSGPSSREGSTDASGSFRFAGLPPGTYALRVDPPVYAGALGQVVSGIVLVAGTSTRRDVSLAAAGWIDGIVTDRAGAPASGVEVMLYGSGAPAFWSEPDSGEGTAPAPRNGAAASTGNRARLRAQVSRSYGSYWSSMVTGSDGRFAFGLLPAGHFRVVTSGPPDRTLGPSSADVDVTLGQTAEAAVVLPPAGRITGVVRGASGGVLAGVNMQLGGLLSYDFTATDADGRYSFAGLAPGEYDAHVIAPYGEGSGSRQVHVSVPEGASVTQDFLLDATGAVGGVVSGPSGPLKGARVNLTGYNTSESRPTGPDGSYLFEHLAAGTYQMEVEAPRGSGLNGARADVVLAPLQTLRKDFSLVEATGSIAGTVRFTGTQTGRVLVGLFEAQPAYSQGAAAGRAAKATRVASRKGRSARTRGWAAIADEVAGTEGPLAQASLAAPGSFTIGRVPDGQYSVLAVMDMNGNGQVDPNEPVGRYGKPNAVFVAGGAAVAGVDITLRLPFAALDLSEGLAVPRTAAPGSSVRLRVRATGAVSVAAEVRDAATGASLGTTSLLDDGAHGDGAARDDLYGGEFAVPSGAPPDCTVDFAAIDGDGNRTVAAAFVGFATSSFTQTASVLFVSAAADAHLLKVDGQGNADGEDPFSAPLSGRPSAERYYVDALRAADRSYDVWRTVCRGPIDTATLLAYAAPTKAVVMAWPYADMTWGPVAQDDAIARFLEAGGRLLISGQDIGWNAEGQDLGHFDSVFREYLHAGLVSDYGSFELEGRAADPLTDGLRFRISGGDGANNQSSPDVIVALPPAQPLMSYVSSPAAFTRAASPTLGRGRVLYPRASHQPRRGRAYSQAGEEPPCGGLRVDNGRYKAVYLAFGLEAVADSAQRAALLARGLDFLLAPTSTATGIEANVAPGSLPADGVSESTLTASVTNSAGGPVPDGTLVSFRGYNATVPASARTAGGSVSVRVRAGLSPGSMAVAISSGAASATATINGTEAAPAVVSARSLSRTTVEVTFDRAMQRATAETAANYAISPALSVTAAALMADATRVTLTTANQLGVTYALTVTGVLDSSGKPVGARNRATFVGTGPAATVTVAASPDRIVADGTDASQIKAAVLNPDGSPAADGTTVQFSTSLGTLASTSVVTSGGTASTSLTSRSTGTAVVTALVGQVQATARVEVLAAGPATITLQASPSQVPASGTHTATLTAAVADALARPLNGIPVTFSTSLGTLTAATANTTGGAATTGVRSTTVGTATVTATTGNGLSATATVEFTAAATAQTVTVTTNPSTLAADGASTAEVTITVADSSGQPMPDGTPVAVSASLGSIQPGGTTTGGKLVLTYTAGTTVGTATITATVAMVAVPTGGVTGTAQIALVSPTAPAKVIVTADPDTLPADGVSTTLVTVEVLTVTGTPVPDGTAIRLSASGGTIVRSGTTTGGELTLNFTAGGVPGTARIVATAGDVSGSVDIRMTSGTTVRGSTTMPPGTTLPAGTVVELRDANDALVITGEVGPDGTFHLSADDPGVYDVVMRAPGYVPLRQRDVNLTRGGRAVLQDLRFVLIPQPDRLGAQLGMATLPFTFRSGVVEKVLGDPNAVLYAYDTAAKRYRVSGIDAPFPEAATGRGFWLKPRRGGDPYRIEAPADVPAADQPVTIPLLPGWQIVGSPFATADLDLSSVKVLLPGAATPVPLGDASATNKVRSYLWGWNGTSYQLVSGAAEGTTTTLQAYRGYWLRSLVEGVRLVFAPPSRAQADRVTRVRRGAKTDGWRARIVARTARCADTANTFGVGRSAYAIEGPPPMQGYVDVRFITAGEGRAAVDVRADDAGELIWRFEVASDQEGEDVTLTWPDLGGVPRSVRLVLVDEQTGQRWQMRTSASVTFRATDTPRRYRIEAEAAAKAGLAITGIEVLPVRGSGRSIAYTLSAGGSASVEIVSPAGRVLRRVVVDAAAARGRNQAYWDGRDDRGVAVPAGLVLVQVTATNEEGGTVRASRPVALVR